VEEANPGSFFRREKSWDQRLTKESIIKKTYVSENLPSPLFAKEG